jgi:hypothetical protein
MKTRLLLLGMCLVVALPSFGAELDAADSRDPAGIERFPRSWIVDYARDAENRPRQLVVDRLERLRGRHREDAILRFDATLESALYRIPDGTPVADVAAHFRAGVQDGLLYRCSGRDCGRSNDWANQIFGKAILYGPDGRQEYLAWEAQGRLFAVYIIERGNKRIYANVQVFDPVDDAVTGANTLLVQRLVGQGWAVIDGVVPAADGRLPGGATAVLAAVARELGDLAGGELALVCHLYHSARSPDELRAASQQCADRGVTLLGEAGLPGTVKVRAFGAGPFAPRGASPVARLELVAARPLARTGSGVAPTD